MMPEFGLDFETGASALYKIRVSERMSCEKSAIFFAILHFSPILDNITQPLYISPQKISKETYFN